MFLKNPAHAAPLARVLGALALLLLPESAVGQGWTYSRGQTVTPAFEGWERNEDGTYNFVFGYLNRNWEEELDVPVGMDNHFSPGPEDRGQPTHFLPGRNRFIFKIQVPRDFGDQELVWTLTNRGESFTAYGSLAPDYFTDNVVIMSENGSIGAGFTNPETRSNRPPTGELEGPSERSVRAGEPLTLVMRASDDDGLPPRRGGGGRGGAPDSAEAGLNLERIGQPSLVVPGKVNGLHVSWFVYRGAGEVTFDPPQIKVWEDTRPYSNSPWAHGWVHPAPPEDGRWIARVTFNDPGTYVLFGRVDDGGLYDDHRITVRVMPLLP